jgi:integrase
MLTDAKCKTATCPPNKKQARFADAGGMYLQVSPNGSKRWFLKYRVNGKEKQLALGSYPAVNLVAARKARDTAKATKAQGIDPVQARAAEKLKAAIPSGNTFGAIALEWLAKAQTSWSDTHTERETRNLQKDLLPMLANRPIGDIEPMELLAILQRIEQRGAPSVAERVRSTAKQVFDYAIATGRAKHNFAPALKKALTPHVEKSFGAITNPTELGTLIRAMRSYKGGHVVRAALQLAPMLFQRPNELRGMKWAELDLDNAMWTIEAQRMKRDKHGKENGDGHLVPLPTQAVALLKALQPYTGDGEAVLRGNRGKNQCISENTLNIALKDLGYGSDRQTPHGFRATARTILAEVLEVDTNIIEAQLAHAVRDANGRSYNRTTYTKQRAAMMQQWADYLDQLAEGSVVDMTGQKLA